MLPVGCLACCHGMFSQAGNMQAPSFYCMDLHGSFPGLESRSAVLTEWFGLGSYRLDASSTASHFADALVLSVCFRIVSGKFVLTCFHSVTIRTSHWQN